MSEIIDWMHRVLNGETINAAAARADITGSTLFRQVKQGSLSPEVIVAIARAYNSDPIEGLIIAGLITEEDLRFATRETLLKDLTDRELADEVWERMQRGKATGPLTGGHAHLIVIDGEDLAAKDHPRWRDETDT